MLKFPKMKIDRTIAVAPMMAYTDRHFRVLMRLITRQALLYTEMVTTGSLLHGQPYRHLAFSAVERPLALQLGGAAPAELASCARMAEDFQYDEVNLNAGCPSSRVHSGRFGACLLKDPELVAECMAAMQRAVNIPVTIKTRIGVDEQDSYAELQHFIQTVAQTRCRTFILHARKAWLKGLSPRQNRNVPPLRYDVVYQLKRDFPELEIILNGGIKTREEINSHLQHVDGVMIGREAYENPLLLADAAGLEGAAVVRDFLPYMAEQLNQGVALWKMSRHLMGIFQGCRGAKQWRNLLGSWRENPESLKELEAKILPQLDILLSYPSPTA